MALISIAQGWVVVDPHLNMSAMQAPGRRATGSDIAVTPPEFYH
jgi:hypothetical protein